MTNPLRKVDFGRVDAESDTNLNEYFVDTGVLERIASGQRQFIVGRKGAGKTALFQQAQTTLTGVTVVPIEFMDYAWEQHKAIKELGLPSENAYTSSWLFTFLIAACNAWRRSADTNVSKPAHATYKAIFGTEETGFLGALVDRVKRLRRLDLPNAGDLGGLGGFELSDMTEGAKLARAANLWNQKLLALADAIFHKAPVTLLVDRLDDGWDASPEVKDMLAGAIKAARTLNLKYGRHGQARPVLIFLRTDIYAELAFNDKNKISGDIEYLEWDDDELLQVARKRIATSLAISAADAWEAVFSPDQMRQRAFIYSYMLKRTMRRPRDMIAFCSFCQEAAIREGHIRIETDDIYEGEIAYSRHIFDELRDEMHKQVAEFDSLFRSLRVLGYTRFPFSAWLETEQRLDANVNDTRAEQRLKILFDFGVIGVPKVGGRGGGSTFEFAYQDRFLDPRFDSDLVVHPSLRRHLSLRDATAGPPPSAPD